MTKLNAFTDPIPLVKSQPALVVNGARTGLHLYKLGDVGSEENFALALTGAFS